MSAIPIIVITSPSTITAGDAANPNTLMCNGSSALSTHEMAAILTFFANQYSNLAAQKTNTGEFSQLISKFITPIVDAAKGTIAKEAAEVVAAEVTKAL
jgi:hypothetical protein